MTRGSDRRVSRTAFRFPERRTGFDRRARRGVLAWYRDQPVAIAGVLVLIMALNITDLLLTRRALDRGALELNPLLAVLFEESPFVAGSFKMSIALGVVLVIWRLRRYRRILQLTIVALAGFFTLLVYQVALLSNVA